MNESCDRVWAELESLGYRPSLLDSPHGQVVSFDYVIETGSLKGKPLTVGVSFQENGYPEYPPHWIHVTPPITDGKGGVVEQYCDQHGRQWVAMSRPPGDLWDLLPTKHMSTYISEHLRRLWKDV